MSDLKEPSANDMLDVLVQMRTKHSQRKPDQRAVFRSEVINWAEGEVTKKLRQDLHRAAVQAQNEYFAIDPTNEPDLNKQRQQKLEEGHRLQFAVRWITEWIANNR